MAEAGMVLSVAVILMALNQMSLVRRLRALEARLPREIEGAR